MKTKIQQFKKIWKPAGILILSALVAFGTSPASYAEEATAPAAPALDNPATDVQTDPGNSPVPSDAEALRPGGRHREKAEKFKEWMSNHPEIKEKFDANANGKIDRMERKLARREWKQYKKEHSPRRDFDNNPPGAAGGPGTNWENRPGPQGGQGVGPNRNLRRDFDNNPPGAAGGPGTNWENRPGPQGGQGAGSNRNFRRDNDNNPPGRTGGAGTNWENPRGPKGGPGASPNRGGGGRKK